MDLKDVNIVFRILLSLLWWCLTPFIIILIVIIFIIAIMICLIVIGIIIPIVLLIIVPFSFIVGKGELTFTIENEKDN